MSSGLGSQQNELRELPEEQCRVAVEDREHWLQNKKRVSIVFWNSRAALLSLCLSERLLLF